MFSGLSAVPELAYEFEHALTVSFKAIAKVGIVECFEFADDAVNHLRREHVVTLKCFSFCSEGLGRRHAAVRKRFERFEFGTVFVVVYVYAYMSSARLSESSISNPIRAATTMAAISW